MVGYALERMGWFHFEQLCAALLELESDVAPLAWAGGSDGCRAVLSGTPLAPPLLTRRAPEPVLLVCSWVRSGRPSGLLASVDRLLDERSEDVAVAKALVILSNVERTAKLESRVRNVLADKRVKVRILGRTEIGQGLDARPSCVARCRRSSGCATSIGSSTLRSRLAPRLTFRPRMRWRPCSCQRARTAARSGSLTLIGSPC